MTKLIVSEPKGGIFRSGKEIKALRGGVRNVRRISKYHRSTPLTRERVLSGRKLIKTLSLTNYDYCG